ncbi:indoleacetamide hydrolase [Burkholderia contaminans]|uniref:indoleacetamide hydrolase n=1 Tax=Burkholderia contaminans TaxID=488447 RepID=UPI001CF5E830|nr:indoleacetamide hydrolase [Burkholderia contaminans]MCA7915131.1 indoleacetamide hydrolase [Burkholderia contaminans]MCA8102195.1 indoleacetamide hydrolase [Burkholderia contaminans]UUX42845.1 indoleacetamide hydrolase [Burkholderia contaminans]
MPTLPQLSVVDAKGAIDRREISCLEYVQALVDQQAKTESLNGFVYFNAEALLQAARAHDEALAARTGRMPLAGIPLAIKDNIDCAGMPTAAGTAALCRAVPRANAPVVARVVEAGALVAGKANMHELAFGCTNDNGFFGPARNPYDPSRIPGGSSGGSAVLVASGAVPASLGTDTGGSVRIPAALCGLVGFRPTHGRYPSEGVVPISPTRDTVGPIARTVSDVILLDEILSGSDSALPVIVGERDFRLAVPYSTMWEGLSPDARPVLERALQQLEEADFELVDVDLRRYPFFRAKKNATIPFFEFAGAVARYLEAGGVAVTFPEIVARIESPDVARIVGHILGGGAISATEYAEALLAREQSRTSYVACLREVDVDALLFPTVLIPACSIGAETVVVGSEALDVFAAYTRNTEPGSNAGVPGITVPAGLTQNGLPVGLALDGAPYSDQRILQIGKEMERVLCTATFPRLDAHV